MESDDFGEFMDQVNTRNVEAAAGIKENSPQASLNSNDWAKTIAKASCWAQSGDSYFPVSAVTPEIPPGAYRAMISNNCPYLQKMTINIDNLLVLPDSATERLLAEFSKFWTLKSKFDERGFTFKRGMLMWGPPGSGKTSAVWQMTERLVRDQKGIVIFVENPQITTWILTILRRIEPERPVITVSEDIDALIQQYGDHTLLAMMDGEFQISKVVHLATTNYPYLLDKRFVDRPSRFDTIMKVGMPSADARMTYFKAKEPTLSQETLERWVTRSDGYSVAHLREISIATQCFGQDEDAVFSRLDKMKQKIRANEDGEEMKEAGFLSGFRPKVIR